MPTHRPHLESSIPPDNRYEIVGRIASGGMAEIYLARVVSGGDEVALKRLMPELQTDKEFVQMFHDEANIASQLDHPNIVQIYELGELDGSLFIAMEFLRGVNLRTLLAKLQTTEDRVPIPLAAWIASRALDALDYAHRFADENGNPMNVVHRDVSPQNIIVTYEGEVKLVDFGVAKAEGRLHKTRAGLIKGKFAYMSPEQISGGEVDYRSDLFALAEAFYEILIKQHPFYASSDMEVLRSIIERDPPHPCSVDASFPQELADILMRALKKAPEERFESAGQMQDAIERFLANEQPPPTTTMLSEYVSELFDDSLEMEREARRDGDDDRLVEALATSRAERLKHQSAPRRPQAQQVLVVDGSGDESEPTVQPSGQRNRVEIARPRAPVEDPAERGAPMFLAHSACTDAGRPRRFSSQIHSLFEGESDTRNDELIQEAVRPSYEDVDEGELPTMLGSFTADELREIREKAQARRMSSTSEPVEDTVIRNREPEVAAPRPQARKVAEPAPPPVVVELEPHPIEQPQPRAEPHRERPQPREQPQMRQRPEPERPQVPPRPPAVTHRSRTVVHTDDETDASETSKDRPGLVFFVAGLGALLGAMIYAVWLYSSQSRLTNLILDTTPAGASIIFDGTDTGAKTPQRFQNIAGDREHTIEFELPGYEPCTRVLPPTTERHSNASCELTKITTGE